MYPMVEGNEPNKWLLHIDKISTMQLNLPTKQLWFKSNIDTDVKLPIADGIEPTIYKNYLKQNESL